MDLSLPVESSDHVRGAKDAPVTIVEYADVECPYCGKLEPVLQELLATRSDVRLVYRHFPLIEVHPNAYSAALALEAASRHGMFWELHDLLFQLQDRLGRRTLADTAERLGMNPDAVLRPFSEQFDDKVRRDFESGVSSGVEGTPALFINGVRFEGGPSLKRLTEAIERA